jgi:RNA polymerase sigma factor (TIGR02999 family)
MADVMATCALICDAPFARYTCVMASELTHWLNQARAGDALAGDAAFEMVYYDLKRVAASVLGGQKMTSSATSLVHDAYLRLVPNQVGELTDRKHFFRLAAPAMRQILVDNVRAAGAGKRGGNFMRTDLPEELAQDNANTFDLIAIDQALAKLQERDEELAEIVEAHFFASQSFAEIADIRESSERSVRRSWETARLALFYDRSGQDP